MIQEHLIGRGITDRSVIDAFSRVPREEFVRAGDVDRSYADHPMPIGEDQTISQPYIVALMTQALGLTGREKVLEVGTGSGYQTAIISLLAGRVYTIERLENLLVSAEERLERLGFKNVVFRLGDGTLGWEENAPFDCIIVAAAAPDVPPALSAQLAENGRLVIPIGSAMAQELVLVRKRKKNLERQHLCGCIFVKLIGEQGWKE